MPIITFLKILGVEKNSLQRYFDIDDALAFETKLMCMLYV